MENQKYRVYYIEYDENENEINRGVDPKEYKHIGWAYTLASKKYPTFLYDEDGRIAKNANGKAIRKHKTIIAWRDPWAEYYRDMTCDICGSGYSAIETHYGSERSDRIRLDIGYKDGRRDIEKSFGGCMCPGCSVKISEYINGLRKGE